MAPHRLSYDCADRAAEVAIEVWDQGQGMPSNAWERALQPFQRLDSARGRQGHCGLGLAIVNHVVRTHAGRLSFSRATAIRAALP